MTEMERCEHLDWDCDERTERGWCKDCGATCDWITAQDDLGNDVPTPIQWFDENGDPLEQD